MSEPSVSESTPIDANPEEQRSVLFAQMVMQQSSMAMMLMGKTAHPETGQVVRDLEAAKFFIDQLEMLEFKTKGNLSQAESALLKQTLMSLRLAFVETVNAAPAAPPEPHPAEGTPPGGAGAAGEPSESAALAAASPGEDEPRKKFTKKY